MRSVAAWTAMGLVAGVLLAVGLAWTVLGAIGEARP